MEVLRRQSAVGSPLVSRLIGGVCSCFTPAFSCAFVSVSFAGSGALFFSFRFWVTVFYVVGLISAGVICAVLAGLRVGSPSRAQVLGLVIVCLRVARRIRVLSGVFENGNFLYSYWQIQGLTPCSTLCYVQGVDPFLGRDNTL